MQKKIKLFFIYFDLFEILNFFFDKIVHICKINYQKKKKGRDCNSLLMDYGCIVSKYSTTIIEYVGEMIEVFHNLISSLEFGIWE